MPSTMILKLPEELLNTVLSLLVDTKDYEDRDYPYCLYNHASQHIRSLSLVNHKVRRISLPFLFHYVQCSSTEELLRFQDEFGSRPEFARCIRTLNVDFRQHSDEFSTQTCLVLTQLLVVLVNVQWIDVHDIQIDSAFLAAINARSTLETVSISYLSSLPTVPVSLTKILRCRGGFNNNDMVSWVQRGLRITDMSGITLDSPQLWSLTIPGLRTISLLDEDNDPSAFVAFVERHSELSTVTFEYTEESARPCCSLLEPQALPFAEALEAQSLSEFTTLRHVCFSPPTSGSRTFDNWKITEISLELSVSSFELDVVALTGKMFPYLTSLAVSMENDSQDLDEMDKFTDIIASYFPKTTRLNIYCGYKRIFIEHSTREPAEPTLHPNGQVIAFDMRRINGHIFHHCSSINSLIVQKIGLETDSTGGVERSWHLMISSGVQRDWLGKPVEIAGKIILDEGDGKRTKTSFYQAVPSEEKCIACCTAG
ncbi:hypothetical protein C8J56DRAFT_1169664, partial [Mycena floridula]